MFTHSRSRSAQRSRRFCAAALTLLVATATSRADWFDRGIQSDETVEFLPTYGVWNSERGAWQVDVHVRVFEIGRRAELTELFIRKTMIDHRPAEDQARAAERIRRMSADNESGERVRIALAGTEHTLPPTDGDGESRTRLQLLRDFAASDFPVGASQAIPVRAVLGKRDRRDFSGAIHLIPPRGLSVISDIDDTIRVTNVGNTMAMLASTFVDEFAAMPGMAELYQRWRRDERAAFQFVSRSPRGLQRWITEFLEAAGFPPGSLHLQKYKITLDDGLIRVGPTKREAISAIMADFPERVFILIGDASEEDPEIYADLVAEHPQQIRAVYIRAALGRRAAVADRCRVLATPFGAKWYVFECTSDIGPPLNP